MRVKFFGAAVMLFLDACALNFEPLQEAQDLSQVYGDMLDPTQLAEEGKDLTGAVNPETKKKLDQKLEEKRQRNQAKYGGGGSSSSRSSSSSSSSSKADDTKPKVNQATVNMKAENAKIDEKARQEKQKATEGLSTEPQGNLAAKDKENNDRVKGRVNDLFKGKVEKLARQTNEKEQGSQKKPENTEITKTNLSNIGKPGVTMNKVENTDGKRDNQISNKLEERAKVEQLGREFDAKKEKIERERQAKKDADAAKVKVGLDDKQADGGAKASDALGAPGKLLVNNSVGKVQADEGAKASDALGAPGKLLVNNSVGKVQADEDAEAERLRKETQEGLEAMPFYNEEELPDQEESAIREDDCDKGTDGKYVSWAPYIELLRFIKDNKDQRMSYFFLTDSNEGDVIEKQLNISLQEWSKKFKVLQDLPFDATPEITVKSFKKVAKDNDLIPMTKDFLKVTKEAILADKDKESNPEMAEAQIKKLVVEWEKLREFLAGLQRFKENLDLEDEDGQKKRKAEEAKAKALKEAGDPETCWVHSYSRGAPAWVDSCPSGKEAGREESDKPSQVPEKSYSDDTSTARSGLLCYPPCKEGYSGLGPVCWTKCPEGFKNHGLWCYKPDGHWPEKQGKEKVCREGFHKQLFGKWCSADCPDLMTDIGISCQKGSQGRGLGTILGCSGGKHRQGPFCYPQCRDEYLGTLAFCFSKCQKFTTKCGPALCIADNDSQGCTRKIYGMVSGVVKAAMVSVKAVLTAGLHNTAVDVLDQFTDAVSKFAIGICKPPTLPEAEKDKNTDGTDKDAKADGSTDKNAKADMIAEGAAEAKKNELKRSKTM